jgi:hypothetical protein
MDTLEFLKTILPEDGVKFLVTIESGKQPIHTSFESLEDMANAVSKLDKNKVQVYHACSAYKEKFMLEQDEDGEDKKVWRKPINWFKAKAFWADIDCGEDKFRDGKGYLTKKDAVVALKAVCIKMSLPAPMIIDSGNGVHCYWGLTKAIPADTWIKLASVLKAGFAYHGFLADPSRTSDFSSILRPVGSTNKKYEPKPVVGKTVVPAIEPKDFAEILKAVKASLPMETVAERTPSINDDLIAHIEPVSIPAFAELVADKCGQVAAMRDTKGDVSYEQWRGVIGIIKYCEEGEDKAHEWSQGHPQYNAQDTQQKFDTWSTPPTTCEFFSKCNPSGCEGCAFKGKIKTPLVLGRKEPEPEAVEIEATVEGKEVTVQIPELPKGYGLDKGMLARFLKDKDDITHAFAFCNNLFYPMYRIRRQNGDFSLAMRMHLPDRRTRDFEIETQVLASNQKTIEALARYELVPTNHKDSAMHMTAYLRDSLQKLMREAEELNTYTSFGWHDDFRAFLIGDRLYHNDGTVRKVLIGGKAIDKADAFPTPRGNMGSYSKALNFLYNRREMLHMQYTIASVFGSILTPLGDTLYKGLLFAIVSGDTAKGKTTACWAGLFAFGDADKMSLKGKDGSTPNARYARMAVYKNLPILIDEVTNIKAEEWSEFAYITSLGQEKERLTLGRGSAGVTFAEVQTWAMTPFVTANTNLHSLLASRQGNTQAEAVRMIQIDIDRHRIPDISIAEVETAMKQMAINKGVAGDAFVQYVVSNLDNVLERIAKWGKRIQEDIPDVKYRYYRNQGICAMVGLEIMRELKVCEFDQEGVYTFMIDLFHELAMNVAEQNTLSPEDAFHRMLNDLSPKILVTSEYRDGRDSRGPEDTKAINNSVSGRYILGNSQTKDDPLSGKLFLIKKDIQDWCLKNRIDYKRMIGTATSNGIVEEPRDKFNIGRGTRISAGQHKCIQVDMVKLEAQGVVTPKLTIHAGNKLEGSQVVND